MPDQPPEGPTAPTAVGERVVALDSTQIRALAHPLRARALASLRTSGPATATELGRRLGTNSGGTSYHLRRLAACGLVEEDPERGTARERWWRSAHDWSTWTDVGLAGDADDRAAVDWLVRHQARTVTGWLTDWVDEREEWPDAWRRAAGVSDYQLWLTPEELAALMADLHEVVVRHRRHAGPASPDDGVGPRSGDRSGVERVFVVLEGFPARSPRL